jgi:hypothetical protein
MASEALTLEALHIATVYLKSENERLERENEELRADRGRIYVVCIDREEDFFTDFEHYKHFIIRFATENEMANVLAHVQSNKFSLDTPNFFYDPHRRGREGIRGYYAVPRTRPFEGTWLEYYQDFAHHWGYDLSLGIC